MNDIDDAQQVPDDEVRRRAVRARLRQLIDRVIARPATGLGCGQGIL